MRVFLSVGYNPFTSERKSYNLNTGELSNMVKSNQIWIVITFFWLIYRQINL